MLAFLFVVLPSFPLESPMPDLTFLHLTVHTAPVSRLELLLANDPTASSMRDLVLKLARTAGVLGVVRGPLPTKDIPPLLRIEVIDLPERLETLTPHLQAWKRPNTSEIGSG